VIKGRKNRSTRQRGERLRGPSNGKKDNECPRDKDMRIIGDHPPDLGNEKCVGKGGRYYHVYLSESISRERDILIHLVNGLRRETKKKGKDEIRADRKGLKSG